MNIRQRISHYQTKRNWSLNHLALQSDLNPSTVANWYKKKATPSVDAIERICGGLGISTSEFFNEGDIPPTYLSDEQKLLLSEWDLLHKEEKADFLKLFKTMNQIRKNSNPL